LPPRSRGGRGPRSARARNGNGDVDLQRGSDQSGIELYLAPEGDAGRLLRAFNLARNLNPLLRASENPIPARQRRRRAAAAPAFGGSALATYTYVDDIELDVETPITVRCTDDNSTENRVRAGLSADGVVVTAGEGTGDEMGIAVLQVVGRDPKP
jgi:hypothetical protein